MGSIKIINQNVSYGNNTHVSKWKTSNSTNLFFTWIFLFLVFLLTFFFYRPVFDVCRNISQLAIFGGSQIQFLSFVQDFVTIFGKYLKTEIGMSLTKFASYWKKRCFFMIWRLQLFFRSNSFPPSISLNFEKF